MADVNILDRNDGATLEVDGEAVADMSPTEMLHLSDALRDYVVDNAGRFPHTPHTLIRIGDRSFHVVVGDNYPFWQKVNAGDWEPETFSVFDRFLDRDTLFLDVGAWIGPTALYGAALAKHTVAFEPDPVAFDELQSNIEANADAPWLKRITPKHLAVGTEDGTIRIGSRGEGGDSMTSALLADSDNSWKVESVDFNRWMEENVGAHARVFCKMDIEGFEYALVPHLREAFAKRQTVLYLSLHPALLMESYLRGRRGIPANIIARLKMYRTHRNMLRSLGNARVEYTNGRAFRPRRELLKSFFSATFSHGLIARF